MTDLPLADAAGPARQPPGAILFARRQSARAASFLLTRRTADLRVPRPAGWSGRMSRGQGRRCRRRKARASRDGGAMPVFAVTTAKDANWDRARGIREQPFFDEHAVFADGLVDRGVIIFGGPVASDDEEDIALLAVEAPDEAALRSLFDS